MTDQTISNDLSVTVYVAPGSHCNKSQTFFPHIHECKSDIDFLKATIYDFTPLRFKGGRRESDNFEAADCLVGDIDNTHSDNPSDWLEPIDVAERLHGVLVFCQYSRNHLKAKDGRSPRPKFHFIVPITPTSNPADYIRQWRQLKSVIPEIDSNASDLARFFYGGNFYNKGEYFSGEITFSEFCEINEIEPVAEENFITDSTTFDFTHSTASATDGTEFAADFVIYDGERNCKLFRFACKYFRRNNSNPNCDRVVWNNLLCLAQEHCSPPFPEDELKAVFKSAKRYVAKDKSNAISVLNRLTGDDEVIKDG